MGKHLLCHWDEQTMVLLHPDHQDPHLTNYPHLNLNTQTYPKLSILYDKDNDQVRSHRYCLRTRHYQNLAIESVLKQRRRPHCLVPNPRQGLTSHQNLYLHIRFCHLSRSPELNHNRLQYR